MMATRWLFVLVALTVVGLVIAPALLTAPVFAEEGGPTQDEVPAEVHAEEGAGGAPGAEPATVAPPIAGCTVSRACAYPPPSVISCTTPK